MKALTQAIVVASCMVWASAVRANPPAMLPVQGFLTDTAGNALDGPHMIRASIHDKSFAGAQLFSETINAVEVSEGAFVIYLSRTGVPELDLSIFATHDELWLELAVDGDVIEPRFRLATVPFAAVANACVDATQLGGKPAADYSLATHTHAFSAVTGVPANIADGDDDALGGLSCVDGTVAVYQSGGWTCSVMSASAIGSGTLGNARFSAYDDLSSEGRLDNTDDLDVVLRGGGDLRYLLSTVAQSSYLSKSEASTTYVSRAVSTTDYSVADTTGNSNSIVASGHTYCGLSEVRQVGDDGYCQINKSGSDYTLVAKRASGSPTVTCEMRCF